MMSSDEFVYMLDNRRVYYCFHPIKRDNNNKLYQLHPFHKVWECLPISLKTFYEEYYLFDDKHSFCFNWRVSDEDWCRPTNPQSARYV